LRLKEKPRKWNSTKYCVKMDGMTGNRRVTLGRIVGKEENESFLLILYLFYSSNYGKDPS